MAEVPSTENNDDSAKQLFEEIIQNASQIDELITAKLKEPKSINSRASFFI